MARDGRVKLPLNLLLWRVGVALLAVICLGLAGKIWLSGNEETSRAFESGRRLLVKLSNGDIEGKFVTATPADVAAVDPAATPPAATDPATPPAEAAATVPAAEAAAPETAAAPAETAPAAPTEPATAEATPTEQPPADGTAATPPPTETAAAPPEVIPTTAPETPPPPPVEMVMPNLPAPDPVPGVNVDLTEKTDIGLLPIIGPEGSKPWRYYAKPFERVGSTPMVAIVITGLGHNRAIVDAATRLPPDISLSFSPYAKDITSWGATARATGHEILLDLPMQPANYPASDPGPYGLLVERGPQENEKRLQWSMSRLSAYVGFAMPQNEAFSNHDESFRLLLQSLANRGLVLVIGREPARSGTKDIIESTNTATVVSDVLLDEDLSPTVIQTRLSTLEQLAKKQGFAVGIARPFPVSLEQIRIWSQTLGDKGIVLVPVSAVARLRFS